MPCLGNLVFMAKAMKFSLENAQKWIEDAKLLVGNASFGHATALLRFACEEIAKAHVCWLTSEKIIPKENTIIKDVFLFHETKNSIILAMLINTMFRMDKKLMKELIEGSSKPSKEEVIKSYEMFNKMLVSTEKMRQKAMYVNVNLENNNVETPLAIEEKDVRVILWVAETVLKIVRYNVEKSSEVEKAELRKVYSSVPKEAWETGEISIEWLLHNK